METAIVLVDGTLYVSGQGGEDENGKIPTEFEAEVKQSLDNIGVVLKEACAAPLCRKCLNVLVTSLGRLA